MKNDCGKYRANLVTFIEISSVGTREDIMWRCNNNLCCFEAK